jgi:hypothetical protein
MSTRAPSGSGELGTMTPFDTMPVMLLDMKHTSLLHFSLEEENKRWPAPCI